MSKKKKRSSNIAMKLMGYFMLTLMLASTLIAIIAYLPLNK